MSSSTSAGAPAPGVEGAWDEAYLTLMAALLVRNTALIKRNSSGQRKRRAALEVGRALDPPLPMRQVYKAVDRFIQIYLTKRAEVCQSSRGGVRKLSGAPPWFSLIDPHLRRITSPSTTPADPTPASRSATPPTVACSTEQAEDVLCALTERARVLRSTRAADVCRHLPAAPRAKPEHLQQIWERMVTAAKGKLEALIAGGDSEAGLQADARLTRSEWRLIDALLLFDDTGALRVVREEHARRAEPLRALVAVFHLVQLYRLEEGGEGGGEGGDGGWRAAAAAYRRRGRLASAVLLQRRWHDLKLQTRCRLVEAARSGESADDVEEAGGGGPAPLHLAVARRYPHVVLAPLPAWRHLVDSRAVVEECHLTQDLPDVDETPVGGEPEEWGAVSRSPLPRPHPFHPLEPVPEAEDDLILVEREIETVDLLGADDDDDCAQMESLHEARVVVKREKTFDEETRETLLERRRQMAMALEKELDRQLRDIDGVEMGGEGGRTEGGGETGGLEAVPALPLRNLDKGGLGEMGGLGAISVSQVQVLDGEGVGDMGGLGAFSTPPRYSPLIIYESDEETTPGDGGIVKEGGGEVGGGGSKGLGGSEAGSGAGGSDAEHDIDPKLLMTAFIPLMRVDHPEFRDILSPRRSHASRRNLRARSIKSEKQRLDREAEEENNRRGRIRLPDIAEVRRINSGMKTAQVAPLVPPDTGDVTTAGVSDVSVASRRSSGEAALCIDEGPADPHLAVLSRAQLARLLRNGSARRGALLSPPRPAGTRWKELYCCAARYHRALNDARRRCAVRAGRNVPPDAPVHAARCAPAKEGRAPGRCQCCCRHLLDAEGAARALGEEHERLLCDVRDILNGTYSPDDHSDDTKEVETPPPAKKPKKKKKEKPESDTEEASPDPLQEWIRQKNLTSRFFDLNLKKPEKPSQPVVFHKPKPANLKPTIVTLLPPANSTHSTLSLTASTTKPTPSEIAPNIIRLDSPPQATPQNPPTLTVSNGQVLKNNQNKIKVTVKSGAGTSTRSLLLRPLEPTDEAGKPGTTRTDNVKAKSKQPKTISSRVEVVKSRAELPPDAIPVTMTKTSSGLRLTPVAAPAPRAQAPGDVIDLCDDPTPPPSPPPPPPPTPPTPPAMKILKKLPPGISIKRREQPQCSEESDKPVNEKAKEILSSLPPGIQVKRKGKEEEKKGGAPPAVLLNEKIPEKSVEDAPVARGNLKVFKISEDGMLTPASARRRVLPKAAANPEAPTTAGAPTNSGPPTTPGALTKPGASKPPWAPTEAAAKKTKLVLIGKKSDSTSPGPPGVNGAPAPRLLNSLLPKSDEDASTSSFKFAEIRTTNGKRVLVMRPPKDQPKTPTPPPSVPLIPSTPPPAASTDWQGSMPVITSLASVPTISTMPPVPMTNAPMTNLPMTNVPMTNFPMTNVPMTNLPMNNVPMTNLPMTNLPITNIQMTNISMANVQMTNVPMFTSIPKPTMLNNSILVPNGAHQGIFTPITMPIGSTPLLLGDSMNSTPVLTATDNVAPVNVPSKAPKVGIPLLAPPMPLSQSKNANISRKRKMAPEQPDPDNICSFELVTDDVPESAVIILDGHGDVSEGSGDGSGGSGVVSEASGDVPSGDTVIKLQGGATIRPALPQHDFSDRTMSVSEWASSGGSPLVQVKERGEPAYTAAWFLVRSSAPLPLRRAAVWTTGVMSLVSRLLLTEKPVVLRQSSASDVYYLRLSAEALVRAEWVCRNARDVATAAKAGAKLTVVHIATGQAHPLTCARPPKPGLLALRCKFLTAAQLITADVNQWLELNHVRQYQNRPVRIAPRPEPPASPSPVKSGQSLLKPMFSVASNVIPPSPAHKPHTPPTNLPQPSIQSPSHTYILSIDPLVVQPRSPTPPPRSLTLPPRSPTPPARRSSRRAARDARTKLNDILKGSGDKGSKVRGAASGGEEEGLDFSAAAGLEAADSDDDYDMNDDIRRTRNFGRKHRVRRLSSNRAKNDDDWCLPSTASSRRGESETEDVDVEEGDLIISDGKVHHHVEETSEDEDEDVSIEETGEKGGEDLNITEIIKQKGGIWRVDVYKDVSTDQKVGISGQDLNKDVSLQETSEQAGEDLNIDEPIKHTGEKRGEDLNEDDTIEQTTEKGGEDLNTDKLIEQKGKISGQDLNKDESIEKVEGEDLYKDEESVEKMGEGNLSNRDEDTDVEEPWPGWERDEAAVESAGGTETADTEPNEGMETAQDMEIDDDIKGGLLLTRE